MQKIDLLRKLYVLTGAEVLQYKKFILKKNLNECFL